MNRINWSRVGLAGVIILLPIVLLVYFEINLRKQLGMPSMLTILTEPLANSSATITEQVEQKTEPAPSVSIMHKEIASSEQPKEKPKEILLPESEQEIAEEKPMEELDGPGKAQPDETPPAEIATTEDHKNTEPFEEIQYLHVGELQDGILLPNLILDVGETEVKYLLRNNLAFLVATVNDQQYLLTVTDRENPFRNISVGHLKDQRGLSERYLPLSRRQLKDTDLDALDNQVIDRVGRLVEPRYNLVFSAQYNDHLIDVQLAKVEQMGLDLGDLRARKVSVLMRGRLLLVRKAMELTISAVKIGEK